MDRTPPHGVTDAPLRGACQDNLREGKGYSRLERTRPDSGQPRNRTHEGVRVRTGEIVGVVPPLSVYPIAGPRRVSSKRPGRSDAFIPTTYSCRTLSRGVQNALCDLAPQWIKKMRPAYCPRK